MKTAWEVKPLGQVAEVIPGQSPKGANCNTTGKGIPFFQGKKEFGERYIGEPTTWTTQVTRLAKPKDILMSVRAPVGPVNLASQDLCIGRGLAAIRPNRAMDTDFLFFCLESKQAEIKGSEGAVFACINRKQIESICVPVPPIPEQRRIVAVLNDASEGIAAAKANAERNLVNATETFEAALNTSLDAASAKSGTKRLGDLVTRLTNGYVGPTRNIYTDSGVPYLLARHVKDNNLQFDEKTYVSDAFNKRNSKSILRKGDVLLVQSGHIGHSAVVPQEHEGHNCHAMIVISTKRGTVTGEFLSLIFNSSRMRRAFWAIRSGSTVPHLTCRAVKELEIPMPPLDLQASLVSRSKLLRRESDLLCDATARKLVALDELKASLLHQAFAGQL